MAARIRVEACVDTVDSALAAQEGGADRIELCDNLVEGGTTPSAGLIAACCARLSIPVFVLIRPRGGDFLFSDIEQDVMLRDVANARELGADGVVIGALRADGTVDAERVRALIENAGSLSVTFHRAFDMARDPTSLLESLIGLDVARVLTSGQAPTALEGAGTIAALQRQAEGRIVVLAGGGINEDNVAQVVNATGVTEVHVRGTARQESRMEFRNPRVSMAKAYVPDDYARVVTAPDRIRRIVGKLAATSSQH